MITCKYCGGKIDSDSRFCSECGEWLLSIPQDLYDVAEQMLDELRRKKDDNTTKNISTEYEAKIVEDKLSLSKRIKTDVRKLSYLQIKAAPTIVEIDKIIPFYEKVAIRREFNENDTSMRIAIYTDYNEEGYHIQKDNKDRIIEEGIMTLLSSSPIIIVKKGPKDSFYIKSLKKSDDYIRLGDCNIGYNTMKQFGYLQTIWIHTNCFSITIKEGN